MPQPERRSGVRIVRRDVVLGAGAILLGIAVAVVARGFPLGSSYDVLGPRLLPYLIAAGLVACGAAILLEALRSERRDDVAETVDLVPVLLIAAALLVPALLIEALGWIVTAPIVFTIAARAFGSRAVLVNLLIGLGFGAASFAMFNHVLGLNLPGGTLLRPLIGG